MRFFFNGCGEWVARVFLTLRGGANTMLPLSSIFLVCLYKKFAKEVP